MEIHGKLVDIHNHQIFSATVSIEEGLIEKIEPNSHRGDRFILPGFVDSGLYLSSTLLPPTEFGRVAIGHGTLGAICTSKATPFIQSNAKKSPLHFRFLPQEPRFISTLSEGRERQRNGEKIPIWEDLGGSNLDLLAPLIFENPESCLFCSAFPSPSDLMLGHINLLLKKAVQKGVDPIDAITIASKNPVEFYRLNMGLLRVGDPADCILVDSLDSFRVEEVYLQGECVFKKGSLLSPFPLDEPPLKIYTKKRPEDFATPASSVPEEGVRIIEVSDKDLKTRIVHTLPKIEKGQMVPDLDKDILKLTRVFFDVTPSAIRFVKNFGLKNGAIATSSAQHPHSILAVGTNDQALSAVVNLLLEKGGGIALANGKERRFLSLPLEGLYSPLSAQEVTLRYNVLKEAAEHLGSPLKDPFRVLAFMDFADL